MPTITLAQAAASMGRRPRGARTRRATSGRPGSIAPARGIPGRPDGAVITPARRLALSRAAVSRLTRGR